jgi:predicted transposase/invertase (TIGR01784 family)
MSSENFPHNNFFIKSMQDLRVAKDFFSLHLPEDIKEKVDLDSIAFEKTNFITGREKISNKKKEKRLDMLYSVKVNGEDGYFYLLSEHQSTPDPKMPYRIMKYILEIIQYHLDKHKSEGNNNIKYPIIWPCVFFNGDKPYNLTTRFLDMYSRGHRELAEKILTSPFQLIDLNDIEDDKLRSHVWCGLMEMAMKANHARYRNDLEALAKILASFAHEIEQKHEGWEFLRDAICYTIDIADVKSDDPDKYLKIIAGEISEKNRGNVMTLAQRFEKRAEERGIKQGIEQEKNSIVISMLKENLDPNTISRVANVSVDQIQEIKAKNQEHFTD